MPEIDGSAPHGLAALLWAVPGPRLDALAQLDLRALWVLPVGFLVAALASYLLYGPTGRRLRPTPFLRYVFPAAVYRHASTRLDLRLALATLALFPVLVVPKRVAMAASASGATVLLAAAWPTWNPDFTWSLGSVLAFTLAMALVSDFCTYWIHRLHHQVPALWAFHRLHHSAEVLTPLTLLRRHPVYDLLGGTARGLVIGAFQGLVFFAFAGPVEVLSALGTNLVLAAFYAAGSGVRHSHMWLSYGPWLSRVLISPAQHQVHHSRARRHWDRNFGEVFAVWDWLFGTLVVPDRKEDLAFGVSGPDAAERPRTLRDAYVQPFRRGRAVDGSPGGPSGIRRTG